MLLTHNNEGESLSTWIKSYVQEVLTNGKFGVCRGLAQIRNSTTGCVTIENEQNIDRFTLTLPYAGCFVNWDVLFNHHYPDHPPDFIFGTADEDFCPEIENIKSLVHWDAANPESLVKVLKELLEEYKKYQMSLKDQNSRLQFEYESLINENNFPADDVEVHVSRLSPYRFGQVNFLMKLPIDLHNLPSYLRSEDPLEDTAVLLVTFQAPESGQCKPQLFLSPNLKHALGNSNDLRIPTFPHQGCLMDYVPTVVDQLNNTVKTIASAYEKRKTYIIALKAIFGRSELEYDVESYTKISFLLEWHDFFFIFTVDVSSTQFPSKQPALTFQSVYHMQQNGEPYQRTEIEYPYSPQWKPFEMATRTRSYVLDYISDFQKNSVKEGLLQHH